MTNNQFVASSPDEKAILEFCKEQGFAFQGENSDGRLEINAKGITYYYQKLAELSFDSYRKCMSVIVKDIDEKIHVLCKGAETTMFESCISGKLDYKRLVQFRLTSLFVMNEKDAMLQGHALGLSMVK